MIRGACPVCRSRAMSAFRVLGDGPDGYGVNCCRLCGHASRIVRPTHAANLELQLAEFERQAVPSHARVKWPARVALVRQTVERLAGSSGKILDIGCGTGLWLSAFGPKWEKFGVELSPRAAEIAARATGAKVFCGPIEAIPPSGEKMDVVTALAIVEHLYEPSLLLEVCWDRLKPGGLLVVMSGDRESTVARRFGSEWPMYVPKEHLHFFSRRSLVHMLNVYGFRPVRIEWRPMVYPARSPGSLRLPANLLRWAAKGLELSGMIRTPLFDHCYVYARRP